MKTQKQSRTDNSIQNTKVSLCYFLLILVTTFFSRKVFIDSLGTEVLGLNTTITNLLGLLNLSELGIGTAVSFALFKPLLDNNRKGITEIVSVQGWLYRNIAILIIIVGMILMLFFPWIFQKTDLPLWYAYATYIVFLTSSLSGYFVNYRQIILSADQKQYKITYITKGLTFLKLIIQILVLYYSPWSYQGWLVVEFVFAFLIAIMLEYSVRKTYPWLKTSFRIGKSVYKEHEVILTKSKQLFFHKVAGYVLNQTSPLIIYAYTTLTLVAIYGNYMLIVSGLISLLVAIFSGIIPTLGNLIAEGKRESILKVFGEYFACRMLIAGVVTYCLWIGGNSFIVLWVGAEYLLEEIPFFLIVGITFASITRISDDFLSAYGLFRDIWAPITEAALNLGLSILLGLFFSLSGILSGVLISLILIVHIWKPYFLCRNGLSIPVRKYYLKYLFYCAVILLSGFTTHWLLGPADIHAGLSFTKWAIFLLKHFLLFFLFVYAITFLLDKGMKDFSQRIFHIIKNKLSYIHE
ncbi:sugar transporter [Porphyromonas gulae]|nr:sugar transporter [Porphyromonas sp. COT-052 OH4946]KGN74586.1 sugar transporter [Porphyromonas gulae]KGO04754.1 sugar transporter [Porphyromonas gulae]